MIKIFTALAFCATLLTNSFAQQFSLQNREMQDVQSIAHFFDRHEAQTKEIHRKSKIAHASVPTAAAVLFAWNAVSTQAIRETFHTVIYKLLLDSEAVLPQGMENSGIDMFVETIQLDKDRKIHQFRSLRLGDLGFLECYIEVGDTRPVSIVFSETTSSRRLNTLLKKSELNEHIGEYLLGSTNRSTRVDKTLEKLTVFLQEGASKRELPAKVFAERTYIRRLSLLYDLSHLAAHLESQFLKTYFSPIVKELTAAVAEAAEKAGTASVKIIGRILPLFLVTGTMAYVLNYFHSKNPPSDNEIEILTELHRQCGDQPKSGDCAARVVSIYKSTHRKAIAKLALASKKMLMHQI